MNIKVSKWGKALAIRIPAKVARNMMLAEGQTVSAKIVDGGLVIRPDGVDTLESLLAGVTKDNMHGETDWGRAVGEELL